MAGSGSPPPRPLLLHLGRCWPIPQRMSARCRIAARKRRSRQYLANIRTEPTPYADCGSILLVPDEIERRGKDMKKLAWHRVAVVVAALAVGSAAVSSSALARGGGGGGGGGHGGGGMGMGGGHGGGFGGMGGGGMGMGGGHG